MFDGFVYVEKSTRIRPSVSLFISSKICSLVLSFGMPPKYSLRLSTDLATRIAQPENNYNITLAIITQIEYIFFIDNIKKKYLDEFQNYSTSL